MNYTPRKTTVFLVFLFTLIISSNTNIAWANEVNNSKLDPKLEDSIILLIGKPNAYVDRKPQLIDKDDSGIKPITKNGRTLIPLRFISEGLGAETNWNQKTRTVTLIHEGKEVKVTIGQKKIIVDNNEIKIDTYPEMINNRIFLPLRAIVEAFDQEVFYDRGLIIISETIGIYDPINDDDKIRYLIGRFINPLQDSIVLKIGQSNAIINNEKQPIDSSGLSIKPIMKNNRVLLPVRFIGESLGATVSWDKATESSTLTLGSKTIQVPMGEKYIVVNGVKKSIDISPQIINGRTFLPLRAISEAFNKIVNYKNGIIVISDEEVFVYDEKRVLDQFNYITFGSAEGDLVGLLGTPVHHAQEEINGSLYKLFYYGKPADRPDNNFDLTDKLRINGRVYYIKGQVFAKDGKVIGWENPKGRLKVKTGNQDPTALPFTFSSSKEEVSLAMGTPKSYYHDADTDVTLWSYVDGSITFQGNSVIGWESIPNKMLNGELPKSNTQASTFDLGAPIADVVKIMGAPSSAYRENNVTALYYGESEIVFLDNLLVAYNNKVSRNLKIDIKVEGSDAHEITLDSSIEDVIHLMGTPDSLSGEDHETYYDIILTYGDSDIVFTSEFGDVLKIKSFRNQGNLKINVDRQESNSSFFITDSLDHMLEVMGTPNRISYSGDYAYFYYGYNSMVLVAYKPNEPRQSPFDGFYVVDYSDHEDLLKLPQAKPNAKPFKYGSTMDEVLDVMGPPEHKWALRSATWDRITFGYGELSTIKFSYDEETSNYRVSSFNNRIGNLKISFGEKHEGSTFFIGSTLDDLIKAMGDPVDVYPYDGNLKFVYDKSNVILSMDDLIVVGYRDYGDLTSALPQQPILDQPFTVGSTVAEVLSSMGVPNAIAPNRHAGGYDLSYERSFININEDSIVTAYFNSGNLNVYLGEKDVNAAPFKLGSHLDDVIKANGTPSYYQPSNWNGNSSLVINYGFVYPFYEGSYVTLDHDLQVIKYGNKGLLKVNLGEKSSNSPPIKLGSTFEEVILAHGTPDEFDNEKGAFYAKYGKSLIYFTEDLTVNLYDNNGELNINLGEKLPDATPFTIGSSLAEVVGAMGTPETITTDRFSNKMLRYNYSTVTLDENDNVIGFRNEGDLLVSMGEKDPNVPDFKIGSHLDDVIKALGTPREYSIGSYDGYPKDYIYLRYDSEPRLITLLPNKTVRSSLW